MDQDNTRAKFLTDSMNLAVYCMARGCQFIGINRIFSSSDKFNFVFENPNNQTQVTATKYFESEGEFARELFHALKDIRSLLHEARQEGIKDEKI